MKRLVLVALMATSCAARRPVPAPAPPRAPAAPLDAALTPEAIHRVMARAADWQLAHPSRHKPWDWTQAAFYTGMMALAGVSDDPRYLLAMKAMAEANLFRPGPRPAHADDHAVAQTYLSLYTIDRDRRQLTPTLDLLNHLARHPFDESLTMQGSIVDREWSWCDALFMSPPVWAMATAITGDAKYLAVGDRLWWKTTEFLYDPGERLYFRDSRFFDRREPNGQKVFWSRGNGWVFAGLARVLTHLPADHPNRPRYVALFRDMAARLAALQAPDGYWRASLLDPASVPNPESSGTGFFVYGFAWGMNAGLLDAAQYEPVVRKGWQALVRAVHPDGKLGWVQRIGDAPGQTDAIKTEVYGVGALLLAGAELYQRALLDRGRAVELTVTNPLSFARRETVTVDAAVVQRLAADARHVALVDATGTLVPMQPVDDDADGRPERWLFRADLAAQGTHRYVLHATVAPARTPWRAPAWGRLVPERKDDFAWENDRVAYRVYGPALEKTGEVSSGIDVWAKRVRLPVIDAWYRGGDYHRDHGQGLDFYKVGPGRGCGGIGLWQGGRLAVSRNFRAARLLTSGPVRVAFELEYDAWGPDALKVRERKRVSLDAGEHLNRIEIALQPSEPTSLPIAVGLARHGRGETTFRAADEGRSASWAAYWGDTGEHGSAGCAALVPGPVVRADDGAHDLLVATHAGAAPFVYYAGGTWSHGLDHGRAADWHAEIERFAARLAAPVRLEVSR